MGREALLRAKDIVANTSGVRVIYGDTDSLMKDLKVKII
jgi:DNA polymerase elongation subunit (family B)